MDLPCIFGHFKGYREQVKEGQCQLVFLPKEPVAVCQSCHSCQEFDQLALSPGTVHTALAYSKLWGMRYVV